MPTLNSPTTRSLLTIDVLIIIYALAYQLQTPLEPFLVDKLATGVDSKAAYARLQSFFGFVQLIGSLLVGAMIDRFGVKLMLLVNFLACAASYALLALADSNGSLSLLFASKIPTIFMAGFLCAQTAVSTLTSSGAERVEQLGRLTMAYTIGSTIGPSLGGILGTAIAPRVAIILSALAGAVALTLPNNGLDTTTLNTSTATTTSPNTNVASDVDKSWFIRARGVLLLAWPFVATKFAAGFVNMASSSIRTLALKNIFLLSAAQIGLVMSTISFGTAFASLSLGTLTRWVGSEINLVRISLLGAALLFSIQTVVFLTLSQTVNDESNSSKKDTTTLSAIFVTLAVALALCTFPLSTTLTASSTSRVPSAAKGTLIGIEHAIFSCAAMTGPPLGVLALEYIGISGVAALASTAYATLFMCWTIGPETLKITKKSH